MNDDIINTHNWAIDPIAGDSVVISDCTECLCRKYRYKVSQRAVYRDIHRNRVSLKTCDEEKVRSVLNE